MGIYRKCLGTASRYGQCKLPSLPAGEIEQIVVNQLRALLRHPDVIARTFCEVAKRGATGPEAEVVSRLDDLRGRRKQAEQGARSLLALKDPEGDFVQSELKRINGEIKSLDAAIRSLGSSNGSAGHIELAEVTNALQRLDPVWDVLYPEEQRRVLELLIESITVNKKEVAIQFRANGIEQIVDELIPMSERENGKKKNKK